ncbi:hypothetical protein ACS0TY_024131 [Phlomoides rotata]
MQKKEERIAKKRGRPKKFKYQKVEEEFAAGDESLTKTSDTDGLIQPSSPLANTSSTDTASVKVSRRRTRHSQEVADEQVVGSKRLHTKSPVKVESSRSKSLVEAQDLPSQYEIISPIKSIGTAISSEIEHQLLSCKNVQLDFGKLTSDILAQAHENYERIYDDNDVDGYRVKSEYVPLVKAIFSKYGDISKECVLSVGSRPILLEWVCSIYKRLEASTFLQLTSSELTSMLGQLKDLELMKMKIGWLNQRLSQIGKAREMYAGVSTIEDVEARTVVVTGEKMKAIESYEKEAKKLQEKLQQEKDELGVVDEIKKLCGESLVHGLI